MTQKKPEQDDSSKALSPQMWFKTTDSWVTPPFNGLQPISLPRLLWQMPQATQSSLCIGGWHLWFLGLSCFTGSPSPGSPIVLTMTSMSSGSLITEHQSYCIRVYPTGHKFIYHFKDLVFKWLELLHTTVIWPPSFKSTSYAEHIHFIPPTTHSSIASKPTTLIWLKSGMHEIPGVPFEIKFLPSCEPGHLKLFSTLKYKGGHRMDIPSAKCRNI